MQCPLCKIEAAIASSRYVPKNDNTPDKETQLFMEHDMKCRNPKCSNYNKIFTTVKNELPISKDSTQS